MKQITREIEDIDNSVRIFSLVCYFPLHYQNNKIEPVNLRKP